MNNMNGIYLRKHKSIFLTQMFAARLVVDELADIVKISTPSAVPCIAVFTKTTSDDGSELAHSVIISIVK